MSYIKLYFGLSFVLLSKCSEAKPSLVLLIMVTRIQNGRMLLNVNNYRQLTLLTTSTM